MELTRGASCVGIMINAYELVTHLPEEVEWLWTTGNLSLYQSLYLLCRYGVFFAHIQNFKYAAAFQHLDPRMPPPPELHSWVVSKFIVWITLIGIIDAALSKQVYYLHNRNKYMLAFLWLVFVCRFCLATFMGIRLNARLKVTTPSLGTDTLPQDVLTSYSIGELLVQCLLLSLLLTRGGRTPIMSRLVASGIIELGVITIFIVGGNLAFAWRSKLYAFNYPTFIAVVSSLVCDVLIIPVTSANFAPGLGV